MRNTSIVEVTCRDNRLGWWGMLHHYSFTIENNDRVGEIFDKLANYETPVSITIDGRRVYPREG